MTDQNFSELENQIKGLKEFYHRQPQERFFKIAKSRLVNRIVLASVQKDKKLRLFFGPQFAGLAFVAFLVFSTTVGFVVASEKALPGETLYGLKKLKENLIVASTFDPAKKAEIQFELASQRAEEIGKLSEAGNFGQIIKTSQDLQTQVEEGAKETENIEESEKDEVQNQVDKKLEKTEKLLKQSQNRSNPSAKQAIDNALKVVEQNRSKNSENKNNKGQSQQNKGNGNSQK